MGITSVTQKGQVTIPADVRRALRIKPRDRVEIRVSGDIATVKKLPDLEELQGSISIPERLKGKTWKEIEAVAHEAIGKDGAE